MPRRALLALACALFLLTSSAPAAFAVWFAADCEMTACACDGEQPTDSRAAWASGCCCAAEPAPVRDDLPQEPRISGGDPAPFANAPLPECHVVFEPHTVLPERLPARATPPPPAALYLLHRSLRL